MPRVFGAEAVAVDEAFITAPLPDVPSWVAAFDAREQRAVVGHELARDAHGAKAFGASLPWPR